MRSHILFFLSSLASISAVFATDQSPTPITSSLFGQFGGEYRASVIAVATSTTTLQLVCNNEESSDGSNAKRTPPPGEPEPSTWCFDSTMTATVGSTFFGASWTEAGNAGSVSCSLDGTTQAVCSNYYQATTPTATDAERHEHTFTYPAEEIQFFALTITGGLDKLDSVTASAEVPQTTASPSALTGSETTRTPSAATAITTTSTVPSQTGAATTMFVPVLGMALGAVVAAIAL